MITKEMIGIAKQIEDAQKNAQSKGQSEGVLVCVDSKQGIFELVRPELLVLNNATLLSQFNWLNSQLQECKEEIMMLKVEINKVKEKNEKQDEALALLKDAIKELDDKVEEEGQIL
jgi:predicted nuclease with TOPRIM domain